VREYCELVYGEVKIDVSPCACDMSGVTVDLSLEVLVTMWFSMHKDTTD
jgi:hypothetical protein